MELTISQEGAILIGIITNNGIGRKKAKEQKGGSAYGHKPMGTLITADHIALLTQQKLPGTFIRINDLVLSDGKTGGTEVVLTITVAYD